MEAKARRNAATPDGVIPAKVWVYPGGVAFHRRVGGDPPRTGCGLMMSPDVGWHEEDQAKARRTYRTACRLCWALSNNRRP